jgi:hypothetical protein
MLAQQACEALRQARVLKIRHGGLDRWVEIHAVGRSREGPDVMRCWQVRAGGTPSPTVGWKLIRLDEASQPRLTNEASAAPRTGYRRDDRDMIEIFGQA